MDNSLPRVSNLQLIYVSDIQRSIAFYSKIFNATPVFESPRYVAFQVSENAAFALWSGGERPQPETPRYSEIGIMLPADKDVEKLYADWKKDEQIVFLKDLYKDVFGVTFLIKDPDGHFIRVCSAD